jgi:predicted amidohydrolase
MSELHVSFIQTDLVWENPKSNLDNLAQKIALVPENTDLIILPEMFSTGFSMQPSQLAQTETGSSVSWLKGMAKKTEAVVTGSLIIEEEGKFYNRLFWVKPDGTYQTYNKRHLFTLAGEQHQYEKGTVRLIVNLKGFKIMPLVCYDLRFPVWSRNDVAYDLLIYVANWPERRAYYWKQLLIARAIENQSYVIGVNRVGIDGNAVFHSGDSVCVDPLGKKLLEVENGREEVVSITLSKDTVSRVRDTFQFLNDQDDFEITI